MTRIKGFNDVSSLASSEPTCDIFVWKGEPLTGWGDSTRAGKDLQKYFRLAIGNDFFRNALFRAYKKQGLYAEIRPFSEKIKGGKTKVTQFLYLEHLNIFCARSEAESTFSTDLIVVEGKRIVQRCDRERIYKESERQSTWAGVRWGVKNCDRPCKAPQDDPLAPCPLKCDREGNFYFYIQELDRLGYNPVCRLRTHSFEDLIRVSKSLLEIETKFGSIATSPKIYQFKYRQYIPLVLSRSQVPIMRPQTEKEYREGKKVFIRTGKKSPGTTWALTLGIAQDWQKAHYEDKLISTIQLSGGTASKQLYQSVYGDAIDVDCKEIRTFDDSSTWAASRTLTDSTQASGNEPNPKNDAPPALVASIENPLPSVEQLEVSLWTPTGLDKQEMQEAFIDGGWTKDEFVALTQNSFGITNPKDLNSLRYSQWQDLLKILSNRSNSSRHKHS